MQESRVERLPSCASTDPGQLSSHRQPVTGARDATGNKAFRTYEVYNTLFGTEYSVKLNDGQTYHITCHESSTKPDIVVHGGYNLSGSQLALGLLPNAREKFERYVGRVKNPDKDDWDMARVATGGSRLWSYDIHRFTLRQIEAQRVRNVHWTRTHEKALGATNLSSRDFRLVGEGSDEVLPVDVEMVFYHSGDLRARLKFKQRLGDTEEVAALVVVMLLVETSRGFVKGGGERVRDADVCV